MASPTENPLPVSTEREGREEGGGRGEGREGREERGGRGGRTEGREEGREGSESEGVVTG